MIKVINIGCRLNQAEGDQLLSLPQSVFRLNSDSENIFIINTCAVTKSAVKTSWKKIRHQINSKRQRNNAKLIVTGCLAQLEYHTMLKTSGIDMVLTQSEKISLLNEISNVYPKGINQPSLMRSRPIIKIQDGCPNECSFCIARIIRGKPKSVPIENIIKEISFYTNLGYQEIVLTGLNLGCYGIDNHSSLITLLKLLATSSFRIRLSSIEPDTITNELLDLWQSASGGHVLCRHLHIPLQSGDDRILLAMRRKYNSYDYQKLIERIVQKIPGVNIGTDIIVGFPNEDETAFNNTLKLVEELPFGYLHIFPYSPRPNTESAKLPDNVPDAVKKERVRILREIARKKKQSFQERFKNTELEILVETNSWGLSDNYIRIRLPQNKNYQIGRLYKIAISDLLEAKTDTVCLNSPRQTLSAEVDYVC